jgi:NADPH-dependent curcumin reductase CurA
VTQELGFDACIDYKQHQDLESLSQALKEACPDGIHGHFEKEPEDSSVMLSSPTSCRLFVTWFMVVPRLN